MRMLSAVTSHLPSPALARLAVLAALLCGTSAHADEGMWTFNNFPAAQVKARYGFEPTAAWLDHLRLSSVRIAGGCSASVVSASGLVMTNHHCARGCIENVSGLVGKDYARDGFLAATAAQEPRCPGMELNQLTRITDVTQQVQAATRDAPTEQLAAVQKATLAAIEKACATSDALRCEVVSLYHGGRYDLYQYRRFQDIRLVFAPEEQMAFFGGDPDNFNFPRYDLDVAFIRIYGADGKPMPMADHLAWSDGRIREGDLTFVSGNPGGTSREFTVAQLEDDRDFQLPRAMARVAELRGLFTEYQRRGPEQARHSADALFGVENYLKSEIGRQGALAQPAFFGQLVKNEQTLRARVMADPALAPRYGAVWDRIAELVAHDRQLRTEYEALERGVQSDLFAKARGLVRYAAESGKPNGERLQEFADARLPQFRQGLLAKRPVYDEFEITRLTWSLTKLREDLGPDHPAVQRALGRRSPADVATAAVTGSRLKEIETDAAGNATGGFRKALLDGGKAAIDASNDSMLVLARSIDADARAIRLRRETEVEGPLRRQEELLAKARFAVDGEGAAPDATFTLRLSYGAVQGFEHAGRRVPPFTQIGGAFKRNTGAYPFALPASWLAAEPRLGAATPFNFVTTNDIIGGNSGSPMVNQRGEVVGLVFDGNIYSLGGEYGFDAALNRSVAVHSQALLEALDKVYQAQRLIEELTGSAAR